MDWFRDILQLITVVLLIKIYYTVRKIRKVQSGGLGDDTMSGFSGELLKSAGELAEEKRQQAKQNRKREQ